MSLSLSYRALSRLYDLAEIMFFPLRTSSPRHAVLNLLPAGPIRVLDLCTGTAVNGLLIAEQRMDASVVGVDSSPNMLSIADRKKRRRRAERLELLQMDAAHLEFDDQSFDVVILSLILHETGKTLGGRILGEARRVLKPGGRVLVVEWAQPQSLGKRAMFTIIRRLEHPSFGHFLKTDFAKYFEGNGLVITREQACDYSRVFELMSVPAHGVPQAGPLQSMFQSV